MNHFDFCVPTDIRFGKGRIKVLSEVMKPYGKKILWVYGGGSVIDASKPIACSACYEGDSWELMMDRSLMIKALPIFDVLTISTTGLDVRLSPTKKLMKNWKSHRLCYIRQFPFVVLLIL